MAVRINNAANLRRAQRWDERDDAALGRLLKQKIKDVNVAMRECESPYERSRLKSQKRHYKVMLKKVENGAYNGDIIFSELQAASALRSEQALRSAEYATMRGGKRYVTSYDNMDFDYESAFRKKRYYGIALPIILFLLSVIYIGVFILGAFSSHISADITAPLEKFELHIDGLFLFKLDEFDIEVPNDGKWPDGIYGTKTAKTEEDGSTTYTYTPADEKDILPKGTVYTAGDTTPATVRLNADLGMIAVYISPFDVVKAWFRTPMLEKTRIDFLEDSEYFKGDSYYYLSFLSGDKRSALVIRKDENGQYDKSVIIRHIGTYGTIILLLVSFILGAVNIIVNLIRIFTYTSRRLHALTTINFLVSVLCMLCPAFATIEGTEIGPAMSGYFSYLGTIGSKDGAALAKFITDGNVSVGISLLFFIPIVLNLVMMIMPFLFRNRLKKRVSTVPRGNKRRSALNDPLYADEDMLRRLV